MITILTASFNAIAGLKETVDSAQAQTFRDFEHIVVDGGSQDGTREYLESLGDAVRWVSESDDGIADAMNKGWAMARGDWVLVLQAEDTLVDAEALERAAPYLATGPDVLAFDMLYVRDGETRRLTTPHPARRLMFKSLNHQGIICRRALFDELGGFDPSYGVCMDYEFFRRAARAGATFAQIPELLSRMPGTGISARRDWPSLRTRFAEERRVHMKHCPGPGMRAVYAVYWPLYLGYRWAQAAYAR